jgi:iron(III) transport system substrate-binding protein
MKSLRFQAWFWALTILFSFEASAQTIGKSFDEVVRLATKEGKVRMASGLQDDEEPLVLKGFYQKYPMIKVDSTRISGSASRERLFSEALSGLVEYDLADISAEVQARYVKAGILAGPIEWRRLFPSVQPLHFSPDGYFVAVGFSTHVLVYNPSLVPPDRVPKKWEDCLDSYWKGKFVVDTRPKTLAGLALEWGEEKTLQYARRLKENNPVWKRGQTEALTQVAAGEYPMVCGGYYQSTHRILRRDPKAKLVMSLPRELPSSMGESLAIFKGAKNPNAALLLAGWLASAEGQKGYDEIGRGSPFVEGSEKWKLIQKVGAKVIFRGWEDNDSEEAITRKIVAAWGFTGKK